jgi:hypothetical protein
VRSSVLEPSPASSSLTDLNHYADCTCSWCVNYGRMSDTERRSLMSAHGCFGYGALRFTWSPGLRAVSPGEKSKDCSPLNTDPEAMVGVVFFAEHRRGFVAF